MAKVTVSKSFWSGLVIILLAVLFLSAAIVWGMRVFHMPGATYLSLNRAATSESAAGNSGMPMMYASDSFATSKDALASTIMPPYPAPSAGDTAATAEPRIIKTGTLELEVNSARDGAKKVEEIASSAGGFVQSSTTSEDNVGTVTSYVTVRVPSNTFEETMNALRGIAVKISTDSTNGQDVTEQYTDLEARLKNAQAQETQYLEILKQATSVQDILSVQQYLSSVRYDIESLQGQIKYLGNQTDYSTISVTLFEGAHLQIPTAKFDLLGNMKQAVRAVILLAQALLTFTVWFLIIGGAFAIPTLFIIYVIYRVVRAILKK